MLCLLEKTQKKPPFLKKDYGSSKAFQEKPFRKNLSFFDTLTIGYLTGTQSFRTSGVGFGIYR
jgi:hypothetical protein